MTLGSREERLRELGEKLLETRNTGNFINFNFLFCPHDSKFLLSTDVRSFSKCCLQSGNQIRQKLGFSFCNALFIYLKYMFILKLCFIKNK